MEIFMQILGYLGAIGIAIFSMPELVNVIKTKKTWHLNSWLFGLLAFASYCFVISGFYNIGIPLSEGKTFDTSLAFQLAVTIANIFSGSVALIILVFKWVNIFKAKKRGISEKEYFELKNKKDN